MDLKSNLTLEKGSKREKREIQKSQSRLIGKGGSQLKGVYLFNRNRVSREGGERSPVVFCLADLFEGMKEREEECSTVWKKTWYSVHAQKRGEKTDRPGRRLNSPTHHGERPRT